jgi:tRNA A37 threonylcarbamoyladenosine dehydratase
MKSENGIFSRAHLLLGDDAMARISKIRVIIFGVGGVGSWCAEGLVRTGVSHLTIVDADRVSITNVNRQLMATTETVGRVKVEALKERLLAINPTADITALEKVFCEQTVQDFALTDYDYVIDAIDSLKDKALLILTATAAGVTLYSSMGAALKVDPTAIRVAEFWKVEGDPLARALRKRFKRDGRYPARKFLCVYSPERRENTGQDTSLEPETQLFHKAQVNGSLVHITAIFGFTLSGLVIEDIIKTLTPDAPDAPKLVLMR